MTIDAIALLFVLTLGSGSAAPACQRETIVELFRLVSTGSGSIADRERLWAHQGELEAGLVTCAMFPNLTGGEPTGKQVRAVNRVLQDPKNHPSEVFAFLRHRWPSIFSKVITPRQVSDPVFESSPATFEYRVRIDSETVRVRFDGSSCLIMSFVAPNGQEVLSKPDCRWRQKVGNQIPGSRSDGGRSE